jgi:hypothetical protein
LGCGFLLNYNEVIIGRGYTKQFGHKLSNKTGLISALEWFDLVHPEDQLKVGDNRLNSINNPKKTNGISNIALRRHGHYTYNKRKGL